VKLGSESVCEYERSDTQTAPYLDLLTNFVLGRSAQPHVGQEQVPLFASTLAHLTLEAIGYVSGLSRVVG